jgi:hypothetical protein
LKSENHKLVVKCRGQHGNSGHDAMVDPLLYTQFADKVTIIRKSSRFGMREFESELQQAQHLRDHLAHANDYASSAKAAAKVSETVRLIEKWTALLSKWPESSGRDREINTACV